MWTELGHNSELLTPYTTKHNFWFELASIQKHRNIKYHSNTCNLNVCRHGVGLVQYASIVSVISSGIAHPFRPSKRQWAASGHVSKSRNSVTKASFSGFSCGYMVRKVKLKADAADACGRNGIEWLLHGQWSLQQAPEASKNVSCSALLPWKFWIKTMTCLKTCE